mmetsp:Transcript_19031/g.34405  ORF Transcript_19031/g.34405 Transcript_19031/m.34405 type:complete len:135 (-) Transcript_19031:93-497(-)
MGALLTSRPKQMTPPGRAEIGRAAWRYVHTLAAHYPVEPSAREQEVALQWIRSFVHAYPCGLCSREFVEVCSDLPPRLASRGEYVAWWSEAHNRVRADLSQQEVQCSQEELLRSGSQGRFVTERESTSSEAGNP